MTTKNELREGFTSGTAVAAAAAVAVRMMLGGGEVRKWSVILPPVKGDWRCGGGPRLDVPVESCERRGNTGVGAVRKDAGDDPDVTNGLLFSVTASREAPEEFGYRGKSALERLDGFSVFLYAGKGVGVVTLPGIALEVGCPAINMHPRSQIAASAALAAQAAGFDGPVHLLVEVCGGEEAAEKTMNPRLGIAGGISILGTRGIVRPYSHAAWKKAILQSLEFCARSGSDAVCLTTGRRSEEAAAGICQQMPRHAFIQVADFAAFSVKQAARLGFSRIIWACFFGKLLKLAQGLKNTHADKAAADLELLAKTCALCGGSAKDVKHMLTLPMASGGLDYIRSRSGATAARVIASLADTALENISAWVKSTRRAGGGPSAECTAVNAPKLPELVLHVFHLDGSLAHTVARKLSHLD